MKKRMVLQEETICPVCSGTVANPYRYIHGPTGVTTVEDIENTVRLVKTFIKHISS